MDRMNVEFRCRIYPKSGIRSSLKLGLLLQPVGDARIISFPFQMSTLGMLTSILHHIFRTEHPILGSLLTQGYNCYAIKELRKWRLVE